MTSTNETLATLDRDEKRLLREQYERECQGEPPWRWPGSGYKDATGTLRHHADLAPDESERREMLTALKHAAAGVSLTGTETRSNLMSALHYQIVALQRQFEYVKWRHFSDDPELDVAERAMLAQQRAVHKHAARVRVTSLDTDKRNLIIERVVEHVDRVRPLVAKNANPETTPEGVADMILRDVAGNYAYTECAGCTDPVERVEQAGFAGSIDLELASRLRDRRHDALAAIRSGLAGNRRLLLCQLTSVLKNEPLGTAKGRRDSVTQGFDRWLADKARASKLTTS